MATETLFPSYIHRARLPGAAKLNRELSREILALEEIDKAGRDWSRKNYIGGYSSYASLTRLHRTSPNFADLEKLIRPHLKKYLKALKWDLLGRKLEMTTCWANAMGTGTHHTLHNHPLCVISGVYYVDAPSGSSPLKIEDPRMAMLMASPPRIASAPATEQNYYLIKAQAGDVVLFESWMRHEVPPHRGHKRRLSISFNYEF